MADEVRGCARVWFGGPDMLEGVVHDLTGIGLFVVAVILLFAFDGILGLGAAMFGRFARRSENPKPAA